MASFRHHSGDALKFPCGISIGQIRRGPGHQRSKAESPNIHFCVFSCPHFLTCDLKRLSCCNKETQTVQRLKGVRSSFLPPASSPGEQPLWQRGAVPSSQRGSQVPSSTLCSLGLGVQPVGIRGRGVKGRQQFPFLIKLQITKLL